MSILKKANSYANVKQNTDSELVSSAVSTENSNTNFFINGSMDFWQRAFTFASIAHSAYSADRIRYTKVGSTVVHTVSRDTDVPSLAVAGHHFNYSLKADVTTADAAVAAADVVTLGSTIEGYNYANLIGKTITLSFWVKATLPGVYCIAFRNNGVDRSYITEYQVNSASVWEYKTVSVPLTQTGGTEDFTYNTGLRIDWVLMAGTNHQTSPNTWFPGGRYATSNQVNACANTTYDFFLTGIMLNIGDAAVDFIRAGGDFGTEFIKCKRYFEKSYFVDTPVGSVGGIGAFVQTSDDGTSGGQGDGYIFTSVEKRDAPTVVIYSPGSGAAGQSRETGGVAGDVPTTASTVGTKGWRINPNFTGTNSVILAHWTADAELT